MEVLFCEIDGQVLGGMQFRVLLEVPLCETDSLGWRSFVLLLEVLPAWAYYPDNWKP